MTAIERQSDEEVVAGDIVPGADLSGRDLTGMDLEHADLSGADLTGARLVGCNLRGALLEDAIIEGAQFLGADLTAANLSGARAARANFGQAQLADAVLFNADLTGATLSHADLAKADMRVVQLEGARLLNVNLAGADLSRANLRRADLTGASVAGAVVRNTDLHEATVRGLRGYDTADWIGSGILGVDFAGAYMARREIMDQNYLHEFRTRSRRHAIIYRIWWLTSDCGRSVLRWGAWTVVLALLFALAYTTVDVDFGDYPTSLSPFYYSVVTLTTLGYGDVLPASLSAQILVIAQVILGYVMLGGLLSIFATRMGRRAE